jgi:NADP-dependent 3-hydroxy acid dehydrogenase YdfG
MLTNFITDDDPENFRKLFEVNVIASCLCIKEAVKLMKEQGSGHIIVMNSILGHRIPDIPPTLKPPFGLYPATKFALTALCQTLRSEMSYLKLPIKITSISPGMVESELLTNLNPHLVAVMPKLKVEDVADAVKYALNTPQRVRVNFFDFFKILC